MLKRDQRTLILELHARECETWKIQQILQISHSATLKAIRSQCQPKVVRIDNTPVAVPRIPRRR